jgi:hypothetical protein
MNAVNDSNNKKRKKKLTQIETSQVNDVTKDVPLQEVPLSDEIIKALDNKLSETIKNEIEHRKAKNVSDYKILESIASEYLKSFLILGFGMKGEKIFIGHATTSEQHDSLVEHLRQTFINVMGNNV